MREMILGTRSSELAIVQTEMVRKKLSGTGVEYRISKHVSHGDRNLKKALYEMRGVGVFVRELNERIMDGEIHAAVHSAKDIPSRIPDSLEISAVLKRGVPNDVLVAEKGLDDMESGSIIGTSSIRRIKELRTVRPDLKTSNIRGNIQTRLERLSNGEFGGIILAQAAIDRLSLKANSHFLQEDTFVPAPNQGIIAAISMKGSEASAILREIDHAETRRNMEIERRVIEELNLGCSTPVGILSRTSGNKNRIFARFFSLNGDEYTDFEDSISDDSDLGEYIASLKQGIPEEYGYGLS